jgi:hypothetical protein
MRHRLLWMLFSSALMWLGMSAARKSEAIEMACSTAHGVFMRLPYQQASCVIPAKALPASAPSKQHGFADRPIDV